MMFVFLGQSDGEPPQGARGGGLNCSRQQIDALGCKHSQTTLKRTRPVVFSAGAGCSQSETHDTMNGSVFWPGSGWGRTGVIQKVIGKKQHRFENKRRSSTLSSVKPGCYGNWSWCGALWLTRSERALYLDRAEAGAQGVNAYLGKQEFSRGSCSGRGRRWAPEFHRVVVAVVVLVVVVMVRRKLMVAEEQ